MRRERAALAAAMARALGDCPAAAAAESPAELAERLGAARAAAADALAMERDARRLADERTDAVESRAGELDKVCQGVWRPPEINGVKAASL